jgi:class 3 adenylate cyclase/predicted ATPase
MNVTDWLGSLGLERYEAAFRENAVTADLLPGLTAEDLKDLGITAVGHRRRLLDAIVELRGHGGLAGHVSGPGAPAGHELHRSPQSAAERRQVSVMFCDMADSTQLSTRLDPEDLSAVIRGYQSCVAATIAHFDGFIARYVGDGVLIYFGYPRAHEDDAERAVRAALAVIAEIGQATPVSGERVQVRIGIATGLVVVGEPIGTGESWQQTAVGETPNLAARLQALAEPNTVVIAASTRRLVGDLFEYGDLGTVPMKGIAGLVPAWQVLRPSVVESRFEALHTAGLSPLIGREKELDLLLRLWARAKSGEGQVVLLSGEAGLGKSRIAATLHERLEGEPAIRLRYFCSPYHQDSALFPFVDQLGRAAGFARDDQPAVKLGKLEAMAARAAPPDEDLAFLADLLSLPASERHPLPTLGPQGKKERTLEALIRQMEGLARQHPVLMVFEDAHWIDPTSRELLDLTVERVRSLPVLLVVTFRPEFLPPWTGQPRVSTLALNRLDRRDRTALVMQISAGKALPYEVVDQIVDRTDGVPLFVEELTKSVLESGLLREEADRYVLDGTLPPFAIPTSLHDSLMARLDRLASVRHVAQIGAAIGREFSYRLLQAVSRLSQDELQAALARLVTSELIFQRGTPPDAVYAFKHALVQDAAHGSLLRSARQQLHALIAEALEADSPELMESQPELLAQHYAEAGLVEESIAYWGKAGRSSAARSAMAEAAAQFQKGLDQLAVLPETPERQRRKLEFYSSLGAALRFVKGLAAPETGHAYARALELWKQLGSPAEFLHVAYGQSRYLAARGELDRAQTLAEDLLCLSRQRNDAGGLVLGHLSSGRNLLFKGRFAASRVQLEAGLARYDPIAHRSLVQQATIHPQVVTQAYLGVALFSLGFPDQALAQSNAAVVEARSLSHPPSLAVAWHSGAVLLSLVGDAAALSEWADQAIAVATEHGFPRWRALGTIFRGWVKIKNGDVAEGISLLRSGSIADRATGSESWVLYHIALLAGACEAAGQMEEALTLFDDALQIVERTGAHWFAAELHRHKGQLLLRQGRSEASEELYRKALRIAGEQGAKLWELRAAASLARLRRDQRRYTEAHGLLAPVYGWFTEGFDTQDLKVARALLDDLDEQVTCHEYSTH